MDMKRRRLEVIGNSRCARPQRGEPRTTYLHPQRALDDQQGKLEQGCIMFLILSRCPVLSHRLALLIRAMSGFQHAPTTKTCILTTASLSLVLALADIKQYAHVQWVPHMRTHHQVRLSFATAVKIELNKTCSTGGYLCIPLRLRTP